MLTTLRRSSAFCASFKQKIGYFSETYLLSGQNNRSVVTVEPTPLELWLATTNPRDLKVIEAEKELHPEKSQLEILKSLAERFNHGIQNNSEYRAA